MPTKIRLARHGAKKRAFYRIVVADSRYPLAGRHIEQIGTYDPTSNPEKVVVKKDKLDGWLAKGVKPTDTVKQLLKRGGFLAKPAVAPAPTA